MVWVKNASPEVNALSEYPTIIAICIVLSVLSVLVVCTRLWVRHNTAGLASDDFMSSLSMIFALAYSALCIVQTQYGLGLPIKLRPKADLVTYTKVNYAGRPIYQIGISFFKIALLISYRRLLMGTSQRRYRHVVEIAAVLIFLAHLGCALSLIFACNPVAKSWNPFLAGSCIPSGPSFTGYAVVTIISDVVVALLPIPVLLRLQTQTRKKVGLVGIFLLGLFTTVCSILRYLQISRIEYGDGNSTMLVLWGTIEFNVGNMVSSLPFLAPVCLRQAKNFRSKHSNGSSGYSAGSRYKLSNLSRSREGGSATRSVPGGGSAIRTSATAFHPYPGSSEENILDPRDGPRSPCPDNSILKSISYSVQVDETLSEGDRGRGC